jgi:hypothetical protein
MHLPQELWKEIICNVTDARTLVLWASTCRSISYLVEEKIEKIMEPHYWNKHGKVTLAFMFYRAVEKTCTVCGHKCDFGRFTGKNLERHQCWSFGRIDDAFSFLGNHAYRKKCNGQVYF